MRLPACRKALNTQLRPRLADCDFVAKSILSFEKCSPLGTEILDFTDRRELDRCLFSAHLGLSIQAVENILRPGSEEAHLTIWAPVHFLHADRNYFEWPMRSEEDAVNVASAIMKEVHAYVVPFFEEYANIKAIKRKLESSTPKDWFALGPQQRTCVLAALEYLESNTDKAFKTLENFIVAEKEKPIPRDRDVKKLLADLRNREES